MFIVIMIVFVVCVLFNYIVWFVFDFSESNCVQCNIWVILVNIFVFVNSVVDFIVYIIFNEKYWEELKGFLGC